MELIRDKPQKGGQVMQFDYSKLRGRIVEKFGTIERFTQKLDISSVSVYKKLNNKAGFSRQDMITWGNLLDIPEEQYTLYFFQQKLIEN